MGQHQHEILELPGAPTDASGRMVDQRLLGELMAATMADCTPCATRSLDEIVDDPASIARLAEFSRLLIITVYNGEPPRFMTDDGAIGPSPITPEFRRLMRAVQAGETAYPECVRMTRTERWTAARSAVGLLIGHLYVADESRIGTGQTLPQACVATASLMTKWWTAAKRYEAAEFVMRWDGYQATLPSGAKLPLEADVAVAFILGAVLHHVAKQDGITVDTLDQLVFTRARPVLEDRQRAERALRDFVFPPGFVENKAVHVKRLAQVDHVFLANICGSAALVVDAHAADCSDGTDRNSQREYALVDRAAQIISAESS